MSHTPGPWDVRNPGEYNKTGDKIEIWARIDRTASMLLTTIAGLGGFDYANARLIAAAPELLEACEIVAQTCPECAGSGCHYCEPLRKAIARAKGEEGEEG